MPLSTEEQLALVALAKTGTADQKQRAFASLLADFRPLAMAAITRALRAANIGLEHAEEAFEQAAFKFYCVGLQRAKMPRAYFVRSAVNAAVDVVRNLTRPEMQAQPLAHHVQVSRLHPDPSTHLQLLAEIEALERCLAALDERHYEAVKLYYLDELGSCAECADKLAISRASLMKRLERARQRLAECVERRLAERGQTGRER
jgi:RNA polymerase sigma factor (sigma-70 family)